MSLKCSFNENKGKSLAKESAINLVKLDELKEDLMANIKEYMDELKEKMKDELADTIQWEFWREIDKLHTQMKSVLEHQTEAFAQDNTRAVARATKWLNDRMSERMQEVKNLLLAPPLNLEDNKDSDDDNIIANKSPTNDEVEYGDNKAMDVAE